MFEQILGKQLTDQFDRRLKQSITAYRKLHSCETTPLNLVKKWKLAKDRNLNITILSTDMSKAFDSFYPPLLLSGLRAYSFDEKSLDLLRSYLNDRPNRVRMGQQQVQRD